MKRKTQELRLFFGSDKTGKSESIVELLKKKNSEEKVYIIDYKGKYKNLLLNELMDFNYHNLETANYCNPIVFEPYIRRLKGEDYANEFSTHLEEAVKVINYASFSPISDILCRKVLLKMYRLAGITSEEYAPLPHAEKFLTREMYFQILRDIEPELLRSMQPLLDDIKKEENTRSLKSFLGTNSTFDTSKDIVVIDLDHYLPGESVLNDLKLKSLLLALKRRIRNERIPIILVIDGVWPMGQRFLEQLTDATENMKTYYINDGFATFQMLNEEIFFISEEIRIYRSVQKDAEAVSKFFNKPELTERILSLSDKKHVTIQPANDTSSYGDYIFFKKDKQLEWNIDLVIDDK